MQLWFEEVPWIVELEMFISVLMVWNGTRQLYLLVAHAKCESWISSSEVSIKIRTQKKKKKKSELKGRRKISRRKSEEKKEQEQRTMVCAACTSAEESEKELEEEKN